MHAWLSQPLPILVYLPSISLSCDRLHQNSSERFSKDFRQSYKSYQWSISITSYRPLSYLIWKVFNRGEIEHFHVRYDRYDSFMIKITSLHFQSEVWGWSSYNSGQKSWNTFPFWHPVPLFNVARSAKLFKSTHNNIEMGAVRILRVSRIFVRDCSLT